jgi:hypothetical protein
MLTPVRDCVENLVHLFDSEVLFTSFLQDDQIKKGKLGGHAARIRVTRNEQEISVGKLIRKRLVGIPLHR